MCIGRMCRGLGRECGVFESWMACVAGVGQRGQQGHQIPQGIVGPIYSLIQQIFPFFFFLLAALHSMWDVSSLTRDRTCIPCSASTES